jgi:aspartokinase
MDKIPINGLKLSGSLVPLWVTPPDAMAASMPELIHLLNDMRVNIAFMTSAEGQGAKPSLCCIDSNDHPAVEAAIRCNAALADAVRFGPEVGLLSFFPHGARLDALGLAVRALNESGIVIHGLASSIAAITFVIDYDLLDKGAAALTDGMDLPPNPAAFRAEFTVRQEKR